MITKRLAVVLLFLTLINLLIFLFRDWFQYQPYADYQSLYINDKGNAENWKQYVNDFPSEELAEAKLLTDSITQNCTTSFCKVLCIGNHIYDRFKNQISKPSAELASSSPLLQYKKLCASDKEQLWCGNFAQIVSFFCWSQGIVCRNIEIMQPGDHHVFTECYLPERKQWVMTDVTNNLIFIKDQNGTILNAVTFRDHLKNRDPLFVHTKCSGQPEPLHTTTALLNYYNEEHPLYYYHRMDNDKVYTFTGKLKRYFFPASWYDIYDIKAKTNVLFYIKEGFLLLWLLTFFVFLVRCLKF